MYGFDSRMSGRDTRRLLIDTVKWTARTMWGFILCCGLALLSAYTFSEHAGKVVLLFAFVLVIRILRQKVDDCKILRCPFQQGGVRRQPVGLRVARIPSLIPRVNPAPKVEPQSEFAGSQPDFLVKRGVFDALMDLDEDSAGRQPDLAGAVDVGVPFRFYRQGSRDLNVSPDFPTANRGKVR